MGELENTTILCWFRQFYYLVIIFCATGLKGVSGTKLHRGNDITQKTASVILNRLREAWNDSGLEAVIGPVDVVQIYSRGRGKNMHHKKKLWAGGGTGGKTAVASVKD